MVAPTNIHSLRLAHHRVRISLALPFQKLLGGTSFHKTGKTAI